MTPFFIAENGFQPPAAGHCFIAARHGVYIRKITRLLTALVPVPEVKRLQDMTPHVTLNLPPLPAAWVSCALNFFRWTHATYDTEAIVVPHYNFVAGAWLLICPRQRVFANRVRTGEYISPAGFYPIGSIHSHGAERAYHSRTDRINERFDDGLHVTFGRVNRTVFSVSCSIVVNGTRFRVPAEDFLAGLRPRSDDRQYRLPFETTRPRGTYYLHGGPAPVTAFTLDPVNPNPATPFPEEWKQQLQPMEPNTWNPSQSS